MIYSAGIDIGAVTTKAVVLNQGQIVSYHIMPSGGNYRETAEAVIAWALAQAKLSSSDIGYAVATGSGADNAALAQHRVTEIACQGRGINHLFPSARTIIDVGGESSKVVKVDEAGRAQDFVVSEKCAAGSGRILQLMARVLRVDMGDIGSLSLKAKNSVKFTTGCAVFAESEAISRIAEGFSKEDILAGIHEALATKIASLVNRVGLEPDYALTGGGARDIGLVASLRHKVHCQLKVAAEPQITAALGAALIAQERLP